MENREIARVLSETADLMEVAAEDGFRIRSYRNAASVIEGHPERINDIVCNPERKVTEIPGIGKGIAAALIMSVVQASLRCESRVSAPRESRSCGNTLK